MSEVAVQLQDVGKMYKIFSSRADHLIDALGLPKLLPHWTPKYREFWALRGVDLGLGKGERIGIIGRNGAGKSTLLRLITGNVPITEGKIRVNGSVQALIEAGGGFHPEFTGRENIAAALLYQGHSPVQLRAAEREIADFTELEAFLDQPFKTYSLGMQARLTFAVATAVKPEILIVDEMLGAGDAYFMSKCTERMQELVRGGATVLLVSHSLEQVMLFCDQAIWLERGQIVARGASMDVCKQYEKFIRQLDDKRLQAKNRKLRSTTYKSIQYDNYADSCLVRFTVHPGALDISQVQLYRDGELDDSVVVGEAQDADGSQSAQVLLEGSAWSPPKRDAERRFRSLTSKRGASASGSVMFNLYALLPDSRYEFAVAARAPVGTRAALELLSNGEIHNASELDFHSTGQWQTFRYPLRRLASAAPSVPAGRVAADDPAGIQLENAPNGSSVSRWPGQGTLLIERVRLVGADNDEQAVFPTGGRLRLLMTFVAEISGVFSIIPVAVLFRRDGVLVSRYIGDALELNLSEGDRKAVELDLGSLKFGNGNYVFSVALYKSLDVEHKEEPEIYDLLDRSFEFEVYGAPPLKTGIFLDTAKWRPIDS